MSYTDANGRLRAGNDPTLAAGRRMRNWSSYTAPSFGFKSDPGLMGGATGHGLGGTSPQPPPDFMAPSSARAASGGYSMGPGGQPMNGPNAVNVDLMKPEWKVQQDQGAGVRPGAVPAMNAVEAERNRRGLAGTNVPPGNAYGTPGGPQGTDPSKAALNGYR